MEPSGLSTLHTDVVAVEVDVGERRVALQRFSKHLTAKATSLQQHSCIDRRSLPPSTPILFAPRSIFVSVELVFNASAIASCRKETRSSITHPLEPPGLTTLLTDVTAFEVDLGECGVA